MAGSAGPRLTTRQKTLFPDRPEMSESGHPGHLYDPLTEADLSRAIHGLLRLDLQRQVKNKPCATSHDKRSIGR